MRSRLLVAMVGLPARGKSFIAGKLSRYLSWLGHPAAVFNAGELRRRRYGPATHDFFDPANSEGTQAREAMALLAADEALRWLERGGSVAIHDATNNRLSRRRALLARARDAGVPVLFVESRCSDPHLLEANFRAKLETLDYASRPSEEALADFRQRIAHYERGHEPLDEPDVSAVVLDDGGRSLSVRGIDGHLQSRIVYFLLNTHLATRPVWLTRHGESLYNLRSILGGDPPLSARGEAYARALADHLAPRHADARLLCSPLQRARSTARWLPWEPEIWRGLAEIDAGTCDGLTYAQVAHTLPDEYAARRADKLRYRYPRGESYLDVIQRVEPLVLEAERTQKPVVIVAHNAVIRVLYGYFRGVPLPRIPHLTIPLHSLHEVVPSSSPTCDIRRHDLEPEVRRRTQ